MSAAVFVSYSQPDRDCALQLVESLERAGIRCWIAPRDIRPSADWAAEIVDAIASARVMVLILSESSNHSPQVRREVERAVHNRVSILPFRIAGVVPSKSLEYFLSAPHWLDAFPPPLGPYFEQLAAHLSAILPDRATVPDSKVSSPSTGQSREAERLPSSAMNAARLQRIEVLLAHYIGPVARPLVTRAAARAVNFEQLVGFLIPELENETDRKQFATRCRDGDYGLRP